MPRKGLKYHKHQNIILNINERSPDNRAKAKQRAGGSLNKLAPVLQFPDGGGEKAPGNQDKPTYGNPEPKHEPKGNPGRPPNTQPSHNRVNKDTPKETPKAKPKPNPKHDTDTINNNDPGFWKDQNLGIIKDIR